ncbi:MAG: YqaE/Pmp3 family membrane protein [Bacteroidia bacterium]
MKKQQILMCVIGFAAFAMLFTSCATDKSNSFTARKYTHFKSGEATVFANPRSEKKVSATTENTVSKNNFLNTENTSTQNLVNNTTENTSAKSTNLFAHAITKSIRKNNFSINKTDAVAAIAPAYSKVETTHETIRKTFTHTASNLDNTDKIVQIICAIFIPPLGVYLHDNAINNHFWIDLLLTLLFFFPGMIYALLIVTDSI